MAGNHSRITGAGPNLRCHQAACLGAGSHALAGNPRSNIWDYLTG